MAALRVPERFTPQQYLQWEQNADHKSEYHDGAILAMAGASPEHNQIIFNLARELGPQIEEGDCRGFGSDQRVTVPACNRYYYPDLMIACEEPQYENIKGILSLFNPTLIIEVLSASTEQADRTDKFDCYDTLASLATYVLVAQDRPRVEGYTRQANGTWSYISVKGLDTELILESVGCRLRLQRLYARIAFPPAPNALDDTLIGAEEAAK